MAKNSVRQGHRIVSHSKVANPILVAKSHENVDKSANSVANWEAHIDSTKPTKSCTQPLSQVSLIAMPGIGGFLKDRGLSQQATELVLQSWREKIHPAVKPSLKELTHKPVTLLALLSEQRRQTLHV